MLVTIDKVAPFLPPLTPDQKTRVEAWLDVIEAMFDHRYGDRITPQLEPVFYSFIADAVKRRLDKTNQMASRENAGPFGVTWSDASSKGGWFLPGELADMDGYFGLGGTRSYRTPAPDGIRFGNRVDAVEVD